MKTVGFCLINNVPQHDEEALFAAVKAFHALPLEAKSLLSPAHFITGNRNLFHGYFPFLDNDPSHKEFYDMGRPLSDISEWERQGCALYENSSFVTDSELYEESSKSLGEDPNKFQWIFDTFERQFKLMHKLSLQLISCLALGLGKRADYFDSWFK